MISANECVGHCTIWRGYTGLMTDVPHILFEFSLEIITAPIAYFFGRWMLRRSHAEIDTEHGVDHQEAKAFKRGAWIGARRPPHAPRPRLGGPYKGGQVVVGDPPRTQSKVPDPPPQRERGQRRPMMAPAPKPGPSSADRRPGREEWP